MFVIFEICLMLLKIIVIIINVSIMVVSIIGILKVDCNVWVILFICGNVLMLSKVIKILKKVNVLVSYFYFLFIFILM